MIRFLLVGALSFAAATAQAAERAPAPQGQAPAPKSTQQFPTPIPMGTSCGNWITNSPFIYTGTCGMKVRSLSIPGLKGILSNNHVLGAGGADLCPNEATPLGTLSLHPGTLDIGFIPADPTPFAVGVVGGFVPLNFSPGASNLVDAAIALTNDTLASTTIMGLGDPTPAPKWAVPGMVVTKTGRTTNTTEGTVLSVNTTSNVNYGSCGTARFIGQTVIFPASFSDSGDSGSVILEQSTNTPVGLLFAGNAVSTIANQINFVYATMGFFVDAAAEPGNVASRQDLATAIQQQQPDPRTEAMRAVQASAEPLLFSNPNVTAVGIGLAEDGEGLAMIVYSKGNAARTARELPRRFRGAPVRVVRGEEYSAYNW